MNEITGLSRTGKIGIIILAAGASSRMGTPKQLLKFEGTSFIRRAAEHALDSLCRPVVLVLGANADLIAPEVNDLPIETAVNGEWITGISSSIRCGLKALLVLAPDTEGAILFLADQPNVTGSSLRKLTEAYTQGGSALVAASYSAQIGTPALFTRSFFDKLAANEGQGGAKSLLERYASRVLAIDFPEAAVDLDTPQDFADFAIGKRGLDNYAIQTT